MFDEPFVKNTLTPLLALVGAFFGLLGTGIGLFNLYLSWRSHWVRVHLSWRCERCTPERDDVYYATHLLIVNNSYFPITVREAGFVITNSWFGPKRFLPCYCASKPRIDARDGFESLVCVGAERIANYGWAGGFTSSERIKGSRQVYVSLVDGRRFIANCGVKKVIEDLCADISQAETRVSSRT
jgi:hypothetical protein